MNKLSNDISISEKGDLINIEEENELIKKIINILVGLTHQKAEEILNKAKDKLYTDQRITMV